jgi:plasmid maintenance system antidote protein VapI
MKNRIREIIEEKWGLKDVNPTDDALEKMGIERGRLYRLINNTGVLRGSETIRIAKWLDVRPEDLFLFEPEKKSLNRVEA